MGRHRQVDEFRAATADIDRLVRAKDVKGLAEKLRAERERSEHYRQRLVHYSRRVMADADGMGLGERLTTGD